MPRGSKVAEKGKDDDFRFPSLTGPEASNVSAFTSKLTKKTDQITKKTGIVPPIGARLTTISLSTNDRPIAQLRDSFRKARQSQSGLLSDRDIVEQHQPDTGRFNIPIDMDIPGPQTYFPVGKPLKEVGAPSYSFGRRCWPEKTNGGGRTSWQKTWFHSPHIWLEKVNFDADKLWPEPGTYNVKSFTDKPLVSISSPSFTIGKKLKNMTLAKQGSKSEPSPNAYSVDPADKILYNEPNSYTHQFRRNGTLLWFESEKTPGPGRYNPAISPCRPAYPKFSVKTRATRPSNHYHGPFATFG